MKQFIITFILTLCVIFCYAYHPMHVHHIVHISHVSHVNHSSHVSHTPKVHVAKVRTTPLYKQKTQKYMGMNNIPMWILLRPHHKNDTYNVAGKELKLCPICHKKLIKLNMRTCNSCRR